MFTTAMQVQLSEKQRHIDKQSDQSCKYKIINICAYVMIHLYKLVINVQQSSGGNI